MLDKIIEIIMTVLPFLGSSRKKRKVMAQEVKEFSELVKDQYTFLMQQLEKVLKDYFDLSSRVKEMHTEIFHCGDNLHRRQPCNAAIKIVRNGRCERERMRPIKLIVIHCSATREDREFTEYDLDICHRRRGFNGTGYHFYIRKMGISNRPDLSNASAHTPVASTKKVSVSATKADSTARDIPKIPVPNGRNIRCVC